MNADERVHRRLIFVLDCYGEGFFALLPVAGAELVGLQGIEDTKDFERIASDGEIVDGNEADNVVRIDDEGGALCHTFLGIEDAEGDKEFTLDVGEHGKGK